MRKNTRNEHGFSLIELLMVIAVMMVLAGFAMVNSFGSMQSYRANSSMDIVISQLRVARQLAISQRRDVQVSFNTAANPPTITYQVLAAPGSGLANQAAVTVPLSLQTQYLGEPGETDTPMAFGTCAGGFGVCIANVSGGPAFMEFNSQGQFTDVTRVNTLNGTIFLGVANQPFTARAVTIMGGTGRVRSYSASGVPASPWIQ